MSIIIPANSAVSGGFDVANSCMFDGDQIFFKSSEVLFEGADLSTWFKTSEISKTVHDQCK